MKHFKKLCLTAALLLVPVTAFAISKPVAKDTQTDTTGWTGNLSSSDTNVQLALGTVNSLPLASHNAKYLLQTADASLPSAQAMGALGTGLVKNTTTTGVQSIASPGTDYIATEVDPVVKAINGIVKSNGTTIAAATAGTDYVAPSTTVNGHALSSNVTVTKSDVSLGNLTNDEQVKALLVSPTLNDFVTWGADGQTVADSGKSATSFEVPLTFSTGLTRTVNTVTVNTSQNIGTLSNLTSNGHVQTSGGTGALSIDTTAYVPTSTTVNSHALSSSVTVTASDVGLGNVTNNAQVKKSVSSTNGDLITWNGTTGDAIQDGYAVVTTLGSPGTNGNIATEAAVRAAIGSAAGNVNGPASAVAHNFASFADTTGKLLEDSGKSTASFEVPLTFSTGLTRSTNTVTVNTSQNIATLSNLTSNGFVKTGGGVGTLSVDTTTYTPTSRNISSGVGISGGGDLSADRTLSLHPTTYTGNQVWDDGSSDASITVKYDLSGATDPVWTYSDGVANLSTGTLEAGGAAVLTGLVPLAGMSNLAANSIIGNNTGSPATPLALTTSQTRTLLSINNVENTALSTWAGSTNLTTLGTIATGTWSGTKIAETAGGTNQSTYTLGDTLYASASNTLSKLAGNTTSTKKFLRQTGTGTVSAAPAWDTVTSTDVGLGNVENTALSTWAGSTNLTTLGTITTGVWNGTGISVANGGTGAATLTIHGVVLGQGTGAVHITGAGTSGQVLTSNGASSDPTFQTFTASGTLLSVSIFTGSGTWTKPAGCNKVVVEVLGGGGAGGVSSADTAGGGAMGGHGKRLVTSPGATETVTVGAGGISGTSAGSVGGTGGTSSFGTWLSCTGGLGGTYAAPVTSANISYERGGAGGTSSSGDINITGWRGKDGFYLTSTATGFSGTSYMSGAGADSPYGTGGAGVASGSGNAGTGYGSGGSGTGNPSGGPSAGAGAPGLVIVWEYS